MSVSHRTRFFRRRISAIDGQLVALATMAADTELCRLRSSRISAWGVGEQIEHLRRSDVTILEALESLDNGKPGSGSPSLAGRLVLFSGFIPRGQGRAPSVTQPLDFDMEGLRAGIEAIRLRFSKLDAESERLAGSKARIRHPALGSFDALQMISFAEIHHHHHMKIITDIRRKAGGNR